MFSKYVKLEFLLDLLFSFNNPVRTIIKAYLKQSTNQSLNPDSIFNYTDLGRTTMLWLHRIVFTIYCEHVIRQNKRHASVDCLAMKKYVLGANGFAIK